MDRLVLAETIGRDFYMDTDGVFLSENMKFTNEEERTKELSLILSRPKLKYEDQLYLSENFEYLNSKTFNVLMPKLLIAYLDSTFQPDDNFSIDFALILEFEDETFASYFNDENDVFDSLTKSRLDNLLSKFHLSLSPHQRQIYLDSMTRIKSDFLNYLRPSKDFPRSQP